MHVKDRLLYVEYKYAREFNIISLMIYSNIKWWFILFDAKQQYKLTKF